MTDLIPAELLEKGAAYIEEHGLWQGNLWPDLGANTKLWAVAQQGGLPVCAMGSLLVASQGERYSASRSGGFLSEHLGQDVPAFNDAPGRTAAEVATEMRACATNLRSASGE